MLEPLGPRSSGFLHCWWRRNLTDESQLPFDRSEQTQLDIEHVQMGLDDLRHLKPELERVQSEIKQLRSEPELAKSSGAVELFSR